MKRLTAIILGLCLISCEKEKIVELKIPSPSWVSHPKFTLEQKIKFNSFASTDFLLLIGPDFFSKLDKKGKAIHYFGYRNYPFGKKLPISSKFFVDTSQENGIIFKPTEDPLSSNAGAFLEYRKADPYFTFLSPAIFPGKEIVAINQRNKCLIPYFNSNPDEKISMLLVDVGFLDYPNGFLEIRKIQRLVVNEKGTIGGRNTNYVKGFDDFFIVSTGTGTYRVSSEGTIAKVLEFRIDEAFGLGSTIFVLNESGQLAASSNNGNNWTVYSGFPKSLASGCFYPIGDSLVFSYGDQLASARFNLPGASLRELKNDGLTGNRITSISEFNDSIYVTTSTGVFYRSKKSFFE